MNKKDLSLVPRTYIKWLPTAYNTNPRILTREEHREGGRGRTDSLKSKIL